MLNFEKIQCFFVFLLCVFVFIQILLLLLCFSLLFSHLLCMCTVFTQPTKIWRAHVSYQIYMKKYKVLYWLNTLLLFFLDCFSFCFSHCIFWFVCFFWSRKFFFSHQSMAYYIFDVQKMATMIIFCIFFLV